VSSKRRKRLGGDDLRLGCGSGKKENLPGKPHLAFTVLRRLACSVDEKKGPLFIERGKGSSGTVLGVKGWRPGRLERALSCSQTKS